MAGFGGALRDGLAVGDVVTPAEVADDRGGRWACAGGGPGRLLTASAVAATPAEKRSLGDRFSADAVDMESAAVAAACAAAGVPFRAARAVSDAVDVGLSPRLADLFAAGRFSPWRAALAAVRQPSLVAEFWRLARDTRLAADNLAAALGSVIPG
jgi:adenosylhomocysteine nucleosidase